MARKSEIQSELRLQVARVAYKLAFLLFSLFVDPRKLMLNHVRPGGGVSVRLDVVVDDLS